MSKSSPKKKSLQLSVSSLKPLSNHQYYKLSLQSHGNDIFDLAQTQIELDQQLIKLCRKQISACPPGHMNTFIQPDQKYSFYYRDEIPGSKLIYLSRRNTPLLRTLAQKQYAQRLLASAEHDLALLTSLCKNIPPDYPQEVLNHLKPPCRELVTPLLMTDDQYSKSWLEEPFTPLSEHIGTVEAFETRHGEKVRSKSEVIIANALYEMGVPYKYECPLRLETTIYPDFTLLNKRTRQVYYWEHFGMMGDPDYVTHTLRKLDLYSSRSILPGKNLLFTYESEEVPLKTQQVYLLIQHFLL